MNQIQRMERVTIIIDWFKIKWRVSLNEFLTFIDEKWFFDLRKSRYFYQKLIECGVLQNNKLIHKHNYDVWLGPNGNPDIIKELGHSIWSLRPSLLNCDTRLESDSWVRGHVTRKPFQINNAWYESDTLVALQWLIEMGATSGDVTLVTVKEFLAFMVNKRWFNIPRQYQKLLDNDYVRSGRQRGKGRKPGKWYVWVGAEGRKLLRPV